MKISKEKMDEFEKLLGWTDWSYMYSNDRRTYDKGQESVKQAQYSRNTLIGEFPESTSEIQELFKNYCKG